MAAQNLESDRPVQADVNRLVNRSHAPPAQFANHAVTGDPPARLEVPTRAPRPERAGRLAHQSVHQLQALQGRKDVLAEIRIPGCELIRLWRSTLLDEGKVRLDGLTEAIVAVAGRNVEFVIVRRHRHTLMSPRGGPRAIASDA